MAYKLKFNKMNGVLELEKVGSGQWAVASRQSAVGSWQLAVGSRMAQGVRGESAVGSGQLAVGKQLKKLSLLLLKEVYFSKH